MSATSSRNNGGGAERAGVVKVNSVQEKEYARNVVRNTKYTPLNFLFKNIYEQFQYAIRVLWFPSQPMNCYFLLIAILQVC